MKIQIEAYGKKHTFECDYDDLTTEEIIEGPNTSVSSSSTTLDTSEPMETSEDSSFKPDSDAEVEQKSEPEVALEPEKMEIEEKDNMQMQPLGKRVAEDNVYDDADINKKQFTSETTASENKMKKNKTNKNKMTAKKLRDIKRGKTIKKNKKPSNKNMYNQEQNERIFVGGKLRSIKNKKHRQVKTKKMHNTKNKKTIKHYKKNKRNTKRN